jgi:hypothetical protein
VALSLVFPAADVRIVEELRTLRRLLDSGVAIFAGGRAAR